MSELSVSPITVKFPHRSRRGILLGLSLPQLTLVSTALALLLITVVTTGLLGAIALTPYGQSSLPWSPSAATAGP